ATFTLALVESDGKYAYTDCTDVDASATIARFRRWLLDDYDDPPTCYLTSGGVGAEYSLQWMFYEDFRFQFLRGTQNDSQPAFISVDPQNNILIGPKPNAAYTMGGQFQRSNQQLDVADGTDIPEMPADFHDVIKWKIVLKYAVDESNQMCLNKWNIFGKPLLNDLEINQLPDIEMDGPMV
ncbi:hypothetical protein LCGC14_2326990, partial [marine sediment metagenome]